MTLTNLAVRKRVATWIITLAMVVLGVIGLVRLPVDFLPDADIDIDIELRGPDLDTLFGLATRAAVEVRQSPLLTNVTVSLDMRKPEYQVKMDRKKASALGVSAEEVASTLRTLLSGSTPTRFREGAEYYAIRVVVPESEIRERRDVEMMWSRSCSE